jgi:hypothetical protein
LWQYTFTACCCELTHLCFFLVYTTSRITSFKVPDGARFPRISRRPPCCEDQVCNVSNSLSFLHATEDGRSISPHELRVTIHDIERSVHVLSDIGLEKSDPGGADENVNDPTLLITSKSDCDIPGPPFLGILSPPCRVMPRLGRKQSVNLIHARKRQSRR